jgi:hypothetical protein
MNISLFGLLLAVGVIAPGLPARATTISPVASLDPSVEVAGLFDVIRIAEDVDDLIDGDIGQIGVVRNVTESIEDAVDDVNDTIYDVTHINILEPFTSVDDRVEDFADDVDDTFRHVSNDLNDWFN